MKKIDNIRQGIESYAVREAASILGVSTPTLKQMVEEGRLQAYRTSGGHLRILGESIEAVREHGQTRPRLIREASPVLQNRRERLEELNLEALEHRARRELEKYQREEQEEAERRESEAQGRKEEAAQRDTELELERERLKLEKARDKARQKQEQAEEREKRETERELAAFRCRWRAQASETLPAYMYRWLSATHRKEILDALEAEIEKRQPIDEPRMPAIIARSLEALVEPLRVERDAQETRQRLTEEALRSLPYLATDAENARATVAVREALRRFNSIAEVSEMRAAAQEAVGPVRLLVQKRLLDARLLDWAIRELPRSRSDRDEAQIRRECAEILADLPQDTTETEAKEALEPTVREAYAAIEKRQAERDRQARKSSLIQQGCTEVLTYLLELKRTGEISEEDFWDSEFTTDLKEAVNRGLEAELTGDETTKEIRKITRKIINAEMQ